MSCIIPGSIASFNDIQKLGVSAAAVYPKGAVTKDGRPVGGTPIPADKQQAAFVAREVYANRRSDKKTITALFTATGAATAILGNSYALSSHADANGTWAFQNGGASGGKTAFNNAVNGSPFRYLGIQVTVSDVAMWGTVTFTEVINDYDNNYTKSLAPSVISGLNVYAQTTTTRYFLLMGEFNGFYGIYASGITNAQTLQFALNCVSIARGW